MSADPAHVDLLCESIGEQLVNVLTSDAFRTWISNERAKAGDLLILNNSFLHRDGIANRSKSIKYLCVSVEADGQPSLDISVAVSKNRINNRFKRVTSTYSRDYLLRPLRSAVDEELSE